jgi:hypothetical protein
VVVLLKFRYLRNFGPALAKVDNEILEILGGEVEAEVYNAQYFVAEGN